MKARLKVDFYGCLDMPTRPCEDDEFRSGKYSQNNSLWGWTAAAGVGNTLLKASSRLADFPSTGRPGYVSNTRELGVSGLSFILPYTVAGNRVLTPAVTCISIRWPDGF